MKIKLDENLPQALASHSTDAMSQEKGAYVSGRVLTADRAGLGRARVELISSGVSLPSSSLLTTDTGEFAFSNVPPGRYWVRADKAGWRPTYWGQNAPEDETHSIVLEAGGRREGLEIVLTRLAVIVGRVADEYREPIENAVVTLQGVDLQMGQTNDIGEFRIPRVQPGKYVISATAPVSDSTAEGSSSRHGVSAVVPVEVTSSGEFSVGELAIVAGAAREVSGRVVAPGGGPSANASVILLRDQSGSRVSVSAALAAVTSSVTGDFRLRRIVDGRYRVKASSAEKTGSAEIVVAGTDLDGVIVRLQTALPINGVVSFEAGECREGMVRALPLDTAGADDRAAVEAPVTQGRFSLPPLTGRQQFEVRCSAGRAAKIDRITLDNGTSINGSTLDTTQLSERAEITLHARLLMNRISGTVVDGSNRAGDGLVVLVIDDVNRWRAPFQYLWIARVNRGAFSIGGIPEGRYYLLHEPPRRASAIDSPQYLERAVTRRGKPISVQEDTDLTVSLRIP